MVIVTFVGIALLSWLLGSLINYLSDALPLRRGVWAEGCAESLRNRSAFDYLLARPYAGCGRGHTVRAWIVQALAVAVVLATWISPSARIGFWAGLVMLTYFGVVAVIDIEHRLILYEESAAGGVIGLAIGTLLHGIVPTVKGGLAGLAMMAVLFLLGGALAKLFGKMRGQPIEEDALGFSDIFLCGVIGLILGWPGITAGLFYTIFIAGAFSLLIVLLQLVRREYVPFVPVAFGPYLLLAAVVLLYWVK